MSKLGQVLGSVIFSAGVAVAGSQDAQAGTSTVCIANVCSNSGTLPNGSYSNHNGVVTTPGNMPSDAYVIDPRTGARSPLAPQVPSLNPAYTLPGIQLPLQPANPPSSHLGRGFEVNAFGQGFFCAESSSPNARVRCTSAAPLEGQTYQPIENAFRYHYTVAANAEMVCKSKVGEPQAKKIYQSYIADPRQATSGATRCLLFIQNPR